MKGLARDAEIKIVPMGDFQWTPEGLLALIELLHNRNINRFDKRDWREIRQKTRQRLHESLDFWEEIRELEKLEEQKRK